MRLILAFLIPFITMQLHSQNTQQYRWENRLLIMVDYSVSQSNRLQQIELLNKEVEGLKDRKIKVISFSKQGQKDGVKNTTEWKETKIPDRFQTNQSFILYLVGLDGGIKATYDQPTAPQSIFALIDTMPMRRAELKKRN